MKIVPETPLCRDRNSSPVGTKTFSTLRISGLKPGFVRSPVDGRQVPLNVGRLIEELTDAEVSEIADAITNFISQETIKNEEVENELSKYGFTDVQNEDGTVVSAKTPTLQERIDELAGDEAIDSINKLAVHLVESGLVSSRGDLYRMEKAGEIDLSAWRSTQKPKVGEVDEEQ